MEMTEIRRESLGDVEQISQELNSLGERAKDILGYNPLSDAIVKAHRYELTPLQSALKDLEIEVLRASDVKTYMLTRQIEHTQELMQDWATSFAKEGEVGQWRRFDGPAWLQTEISKYTQAIPEFVLAKALQVKQTVPEVSVWVYSLQDHPDPFLSVGYPNTQYTWMSPKEEYFIEVWAEPKFEGVA